MLGSQRKALELTGVARSTWHYRNRPRERVADPIPHSERAYESRICEADRVIIGALIQAGWEQQHSVAHSFAAAWDAGVMLACQRTWWRIATELEDQSARPTIWDQAGRRQARDKPVLKATGPGQVWSWDITDLYSPWRGKVFKAYKITDIYSRKIVGWRVEEREADHLAVAMFATAIAEHGAPRVVHADSGPSMTSHLLRDYLKELDVELSHNRPYTSNDNPFSEAGFKTMKYRPGYPKIFNDVDAARSYIRDYVRWYNTQHKHSGIALFSPAQVHDGTWQQIWHQRDQALQRYYASHPERFRSRPHTPAPAGIVGINLPIEPAPQKQSA